MRGARGALRAPALLAIVLLGGCAHTLPAPEHVAVPGYYCSLPDHSERERATAEVLPNGSVYRQNLRLKVVLDFEELALTVAEDSGQEYYSPPTVGAWLSYRVGPTNSKKLPMTQLAITTEEGPLAFAYARFRSPEREGNSASIHFAFGDLLAMARGSDRLFLLAQDVRSGEVKSTPLPIEKILLAERKFARLREDLEALRVNHLEACEQTDDLDPLIILV